MVESIFSGKKWRNKFSFILVVVSFAGVMCTGCINQEEDTETRGSEGLYLEDYFRGDFVVTGEPFLNNEVEIVFSVNPPVDSFDTEIQIFLPEGIELVEGDLHWKGDIQKDGIVEIRTTVKPVQEGQWEIHVYVKGMLDGKYEKDRTYYLVFLTSKDSGQVSRTSFYPPPVEGKAIELTVNMILDSPPDPKVNEEIVLTFTLIASRDLSDVKAIIEFPEEFIVVDGTLEWTGYLKEAEEITVIRVKVMPTKIGRFWFVGTVTWDDEEEHYGFQIYVS